MYWRRKLKKYNSVLLAAVLFAAISLCVFFGRNSGKLSAATAFYPIETVVTSENIFSVTAELDNSVQLTDLRAFLDVAGSFGVKMVFFADSSFIKTNSDTAHEIVSAGHDFGVLINDNLTSMSRSEIMRYISRANDTFFEKSGKYPRFVRVKSLLDKNGDAQVLNTKKSVKIYEVLAAFGQYNIGAGENTADAYRGAITELGKIDATSTSKLISIMTYAIKNDLSAVPLRSMLYDIDILADAQGNQSPE